MIRRYWETIRYLRLSQARARARLRVASRLRRWLPSATRSAYATRVDRVSLRPLPRLIGRDKAAQIAALRHSLGDAHASCDPASGHFTFINKTARLGWPPDWSAPSQTQLWRYHLHYFDVLAAATLDSPRGLALIGDWLDANPIGGRGPSSEAWHPYVASLRLVNWIVFLARLDDVPARIARSLVEHALFVERNLEADVGGNHLLKNLKALVFAGCALEGARAAAWRGEYGGQFAAELNRQLLDDGAHYERAPMYHSQVMADAIETLLALTGSDSTPSTEQIAASVARMDNYLSAVAHPDGDIPLFNDSAFGMAPPPAALHRAASGLIATRTPAPGPSTLARASGYVRLPPSGSRHVLIADVGAVCPDDLPAHAHADLLSFEVSVDGTRLITDSGVGEYAAGPWRDYYRSTRAHNTVTVDDTEQSDCWASFRVGRRARPVDVHLTQDGLRTTLRAAHTGFQHRPGAVRHQRTFVWDGVRWIIEDALTGGGDHAWASFCHFHPGARVTAQGEDCVHVEREGAGLEIRWHGFSDVHIASGEKQPLQGWYADRLGPAVPASVLVLRGRGALPAGFGYILTPR